MRIRQAKWLEWPMLIAGIFLTAIPYPMFFIPNDIAPGGLSGVATLVRALSGWPVGLVAALLNAPLFLLSWRNMGTKFAVKSLIGVLGISLVIDWFPVPPITQDPILAAVFGGVITGSGLGLVIRAGATTGGTDMIAALIHKRIPALTVGGLLMALDCCVILASAFVFNTQSALYAIIATFISSVMIDRVVEGFERAKAFFVFSRQSDILATAVMDGLGRGATLLHGKGAYSGQEQEILLCVVSRMQVPQFKTIVRETDPDAFVMVTDVREVLGEGFTRDAAPTQATKNG